ncbi:MAG: hypothetical protein LLG04_17640 [Parachlamydia sp.]|nr:hypothetical protein [Parachlamydia sp.]
MIKSYRTEYANQVHQLNVSVSKHYYVTKTGLLKYQIKKQEVNLDKLTTSERLHIIYYVIRDHFSGLFYSELAVSNNPIPIHEFLYSVWAQERDYSFFGTPDTITIPESLERFFPSIKEQVTSLGIGLVKVTSGFQSGIRDIRTIEDELRYCIGFSFEEAKGEIINICTMLNKQNSRTGKSSKIDLWRNNLRNLYVPKNDWIEGIRKNILT